MPIQLDPEVVSKQGLCPQWHVLLKNDDFHTFDFVIMVLMEVFKKDFDQALSITKEIHKSGAGGAAIVTTCPKERAELYVEQVSSLKEGAKGSIGCCMEPAE